MGCIHEAVSYLHFRGAAREDIQKYVHNKVQDTKPVLTWKKQEGRTRIWHLNKETN